MKIRDLRIGARLGASFAFVLLLMILLTSVGVWTLRELVDRTDFLLNDAIAKDRMVSEWRHNTELNSVRAALLVSSPDEAERQKVKADMKATSARISELEKKLDKIIASPTGKHLYEEAHTRRGDYISARSAMIEASGTGDAAAIADTKGKMYTALGRYLDGIDALARHQDEKAKAVAADTMADGIRGEQIQIALCVAALLAAVACTVFVTRSITGPLGRATEVAQEVAQGRLTARDEDFSRDETGTLLAALNKMTHDLRSLVIDVRDSSATIASASGEIASGSQELSARTEEQASSLEETASSMEELTSTVKQTAENARQADQLATVASQVAVKGGEVVGQVIDKMASINASAGKITEIISVIDGIAFQTNILALNAAVEAARAGEQGRGFAVVASEVRNLAQRSASAAKEIKSLIEVSVQEVDAGTALVGKAGATMTEVVASVNRVSAIIRDISLASDEQEAGIAQINEAISQMDGVTQQNAALVEESAAASESLLAQAQHMEQLVGTFQLADAHPERPAAYTRKAAAGSRLQLANA